MAGIHSDTSRFVVAGDIAAAIGTNRDFYERQCGFRLFEKPHKPSRCNVWKTDCPVCGITSYVPMLRINPVSGRWHCDGYCGQGGTPADMAELMRLNAAGGSAA